MTHKSPVLLTTRTFVVPKDGHAADECEDGYACNNPAGRFAVADGASESIYAGEWARIMCEAFVADPAADGVGPWLDGARGRWSAHVSGQPAPWHIAEKLEDGAFATFLGVVIQGGRWRAVATGDTCLFLIHQDALRGAFPVSSTGAFGTRPDLVGSLPAGRVKSVAARGTVLPGDRLLLATDALAEWFLREHEAGRSPWRELTGLSAADFPDWVTARRADRRLKNDDVTLMEIEVNGVGGFADSVERPSS
ncbi:MAG TPA: hypothetical protein VM597_06760 [Gemmataceae bacterium]|nr:hypothetical protein [Gemmataceae bacterium]